ncbi:MAG: spore maturation protein [Eubacteriales bacterium]|nr:spore maturation protein [Eubacteriales bacterium]
MILWLSRILIPLMICYIVGFGLLSGRPVFEDFLEGARNGMKTVGGILPVLTGLMTAVGVLRASGLLEAAGLWLAVPAERLRLPAELIPLILVRLVSNSAATGLLLDIFSRYGPDSPPGMCASVMMSCTETVFYCLSIYFGSVGIKKTRYALPGALLSTAAGIAASIWLTMR